MTAVPAQAQDVTLRPPTPGDAPACGRICYEAFSAIARHHNYPEDFASAEAGIGLVSHLIGWPGIYGVVAERDGQVVGSNFMDERSSIAGIGPITVDPTI